MAKNKTFTQQQKEDHKLFDSFMDEFSKEELARMLVRCRKQKNKLLRKLGD